MKGLVQGVNDSIYLVEFVRNGATVEFLFFYLVTPLVCSDSLEDFARSDYIERKMLAPPLFLLSQLYLPRDLYVSFLGKEFVVVLLSDEHDSLISFDDTCYDIQDRTIEVQ